MDSKVTFLYFKNFKKNFCFYLETKQLYAQILRKITDVEFIDVKVPTYLDPNIMDYLDKNRTYFFGELDYAYLIMNYQKRPCIRENILTFLKETKYFVYFCEIFKNDNLQTIGNLICNRLFAKTYFENAQKVIMCNYNNIDKLKKVIFTDNIIYNPINGYSEFNKYQNFKVNDNKDVDILVYGNGLGAHNYRITRLRQLRDEAARRGWKLVSGNFFGEEKKDMIKRTKIVIHIPSFPNLQTIPWAKIVELQTNGTFFMVEHNPEIDKTLLKDTVIAYNGIDDLFEKIDYFIKNEDARQRVIKENIEFTEKNYSLDKLVPEIFNNVDKVDKMDREYAILTANGKSYNKQIQNTGMGLYGYINKIPLLFQKPNFDIVEILDINCNLDKYDVVILDYIALFKCFIYNLAVFHKFVKRFENHKTKLVVLTQDLLDWCLFPKKFSRYVNRRVPYEIEKFEEGDGYMKFKALVEKLRIDYLISRYECKEYDFVRQNIDFKKTYISHLCVDTNIFKDYGEDKIYDVVIYGQLYPGVYDFRKRCVEILKKSDLNCRIIYPTEKICGEKLARIINSGWIGMAISSIFGYFVYKFYEVCASKTVLCGDVNNTGKEILGEDNYIYVDDSFTDEQILDKLKDYLADKKKLNCMAEATYNKIQNEYNIESFNEKLKEICDDIYEQ